MSPGGVFDEADAEAPAAQPGLVPGRVEGHGPVGLSGGDETVEHGVGVPLDAEDEVQPALLVRKSHRERVIAAVADEDVAFAGVAEMGQGGLPLVLVAEQVEVDRDPVIEPAEDADHALGIVGAGRGAVAARGEIPRQGDLRAVDGEDPVPLPSLRVRAVSVPGEYCSKALK